MELERLIAEGITMVERRDTMEFFRDQAGELFEVHTGSVWHPRTGSRVNQQLPIGVVIFPGSGVTDNLADKAKGMGIPVWRFAGGA